MAYTFHSVCEHITEDWITNRQTDRQADRQTSRRTDKLTGRQTGRWTSPSSNQVHQESGIHFFCFVFHQKLETSLSGKARFCVFLFFFLLQPIGNCQRWNKQLSIADVNSSGEWLLQGVSRMEVEE